jgi:quercetin dioxygenase-like cupin family protein
MGAAQFFSFFDMSFRPLNENVLSRFMAGKGFMFVEHKAKKGHAGADESHINEQLTLILDGHVEFWVENRHYVLKKGDALLIPSGAVHRVRVLEDSSVIEVFSPPRVEWIEKLNGAKR